MKHQTTQSIRIAALIAALATTTSLRAATIQARSLVNASSDSANLLETISFRNTPEANSLREAYHILATGDHDYRGHRVKAMHSVESAGKLLGLHLAGDLKDRSPQALSDDRLRAARNLIARVLDSEEVKGQKRAVKYLNDAVYQIDVALKAH